MVYITIELKVVEFRFKALFSSNSVAATLIAIAGDLDLL